MSMEHTFDNELLERQINYLEEFMKRLDTIIPPDKQHLYHLVFRDKIFGSYTSLAELIKADEEEFQYIALARYYPMDRLATMIQACWRGYSVRHLTRRWIKNIFICPIETGKNNYPLKEIIALPTKKSNE